LARRLEKLKIKRKPFSLISNSKIIINQSILPNFNLDISQSNGKLRLHLTDYDLVYLNEPLMDFFSKYHQGNIFPRPAYLEMDRSKTIDIYPAKVIIIKG
jgi:hypothetical protein